VHLRGGKARRHHRRWRYRRGLSGHRDPPGRAKHHAAGTAPAAAGAACPRQSVADLAEHLPCIERTRRRWGASLFGFDTAIRRRRAGSGRHLARHPVEPAVVSGRATFKPVPGSEFELPAELVLLALGFTGPERGGMLDQLGVRMTQRGTVWRDEKWMTSVAGVFTAGDMQRGQSLIVWAIAEGRSCARGVDAFLMGDSDLPAPVQ